MSYQLAGAVEAMQPLMNMITFSARNRAEIVRLHTCIADAVEARQGTAVADALSELERYTKALAQSVFAKRAQAGSGA
jgi:hypothetical protein